MNSSLFTSRRRFLHATTTTLAACAFDPRLLAADAADADVCVYGATASGIAAALAHWKNYATIRDAHYVPALYNRLGYVDVTALTEKAAADLDIARDWKPGTLKNDGNRGGTEKGFKN